MTLAAAAAPHHCRLSRQNSSSTRSRGFTLIELLVVIVILGVLVGLLVPVIAGAFRTANDATVTAEMNLFANALSDFNNRFGGYPPSRVILRENGVYDLTDTTPIVAGDLTFGQMNQRSVRFLRKFWPRLRVNTSGSATTYAYDFNGDGDTADTIALDGSECLVFFLGGIPSSAQTGMVGFAKNPNNPFIGDNPTLGGTSNRTPPTFEFKGERLIDDDGDGIPGYVDPLAPPGSEARFYAYFSAYDSNGYDPNDVNYTEVDSNTGAAVARYFRTNFKVAGGTTNEILSQAPNPYTAGPAVPAGGRPTVYQNANTYQIISSGQDRFYGFGGQYDGGSQGGKLPASAAEVIASGNPPMSPNDPAVRQRESDNITNFSNGKLE